MPVAGQPVTYYQAWNFVVEIDGVNVGGFTECTGLAAEVKVVKQMEGGVNDGPVDVSTSTTSYPALTLKRGGSDNTELYDWFDNIRNGNQDKRNISIVQQRGGVPVVRYNVEQAVISKYVPGEWNRTEEEKNITEEVTLECKRWTRIVV